MKIVLIMSIWGILTLGYLVSLLAIACMEKGGQRLWIWVVTTTLYVLTSIVLFLVTAE